MLTPLTDVPDGVIGFELSGKLETEDYRDVLAPAIQQAATDGEVRIVLVMAEFDGVSTGAMWQDLKMGFEHWGKWKRIAVVTDVEWMRHAIEWMGWMTPGEAKHFPLAEHDAAVAWAASTS